MSWRVQRLYWKRANKEKRKDYWKKTAQDNDGPGDIKNCEAIETILR